MFDEPHHPRRRDHAGDEQGKAVGAVAHHVARSLALRNSEHGGRAEGEQKSGAELTKLEGHCFLPIAM